MCNEVVLFELGVVETELEALRPCMEGIEGVEVLDREKWGGLSDVDYDVLKERYDDFLYLLVRRGALRCGVSKCRKGVCCE